MSSKVSLFDYQKDAVARIIFSKNTLLAHDVGSGKTYEMIAAAQELRRMKISKKNLFVVPNAIINQWKKIYLDMYPNAKLLIVDKRNFTPSKREETLKLMKENEYDSILMTYSSFDMIDLSPDYYKDKLERDFAQNRSASSNDKTSTKQVKNKANNVKAYTKKIDALGQRDPNRIYFEDLEIDRLFVDESHNFKNVTLETEIKVLGINTTGSKKCDSMMDKVKYIQKNHDGGGIVFATATPITNSIADIFVIQKYLQEGELKILNLSSFPAWLANFAEMQQGFEIDIDTSKFRMANRYSKFHNIPELASVLSNIIDFHHIDKDKDLPEFFITSKDLNYKSRIDMQSVWQKHIDASISSTVNLPVETTIDDVYKLYLYAWEKNLKGITVYRDGCKRSGILITKDTKTDDNIKENNELQRGDIISASDDLIGKNRKLMTGCGSLHCVAFFDPISGELIHNIGSVAVIIYSGLLVNYKRLGITKNINKKSFKDMNIKTHGGAKWL